MAKNLPTNCQCRRCKRHGFHPWVGKIPRMRAWQPTPVFLPGESHGQRSLVGYSPLGCTESDTTGLSTHAHAFITSTLLFTMPINIAVLGLVMKLLI